MDIVCKYVPASSNSFSLLLASTSGFVLVSSTTGVALNRDGALKRAGVLAASAVRAATNFPCLSQVAIHSSEVAKLLVFPRHPPHEKVLNNSHEK